MQEHTWDDQTLPQELVKEILNLVITSCPYREDFDEPEAGWLMAVVCRRVCKQWRTLLSPPSTKSLKFTEVAAQFGWMSLVKWGTERGCPWNEATLSAAAEGGHVDLVKWLRENGCSWNTAASFAALGGHLEVLKWLKEQGCPYDPDQALAFAAHNGNLELVKWMVEDTGGHLYIGAFHNAAVQGHVEVMKWLKEQGCPWDKHCCSNAAGGGHFEALKLKEEGCPLDDGSCFGAASAGRLDILQWLRQHNCP